MIASAVDRVLASWEKSQADLAARVKAGTQPEIVMVATSFREIVFANVAYVVILCALYAWMSKREKDFKTELRPFIVVYNAICVFLAGYVVYGYAVYKLRHWDDLGFVCNDIHEAGEKGEWLAWVVWVFAMQKYWEFCDTFFFILRKNFNQVSFLHVYHHASITFVVGYLARYSYSGDVYLAPLLNACVHVCMYSHYLVTALGYRSWWSKYLTTMQLVQFIMISGHNIVSWRNGPDCGLYDWEKAVLIGYMATMVILFGQFYVQKYVKPAATAARPKDGAKKSE